MSFKYNNDRDRFTHGYDAGTIVDGEVRQDPDTGEWVLVDDEGIAFSNQSLLKLLAGKRVRLTCVAFDAMEAIEKMMVSAQTKKDGN
jgi:hypothetical protein